jgi:hypothetical protein
VSRFCVEMFGFLSGCGEAGRVGARSWAERRTTGLREGYVGLVVNPGGILWREGPATEDPLGPAADGVTKGGGLGREPIPGGRGITPVGPKDCGDGRIGKT